MAGFHANRFSLSRNIGDLIVLFEFRKTEREREREKERENNADSVGQRANPIDF
jgi:hypothetical protein